MSGMRVAFDIVGCINDNIVGFLQLLEEIGLSWFERVD
jgi:hypothetical protein